MAKEMNPKLMAGRTGSVLGALVFNRLWCALRDVSERRISSGASSHADAPWTLAQSR